MLLNFLCLFSLLSFLKRLPAMTSRHPPGALLGPLGGREGGLCAICSTGTLCLSVLIHPSWPNRANDLSSHSQSYGLPHLFPSHPLDDDNDEAVLSSIYQQWRTASGTWFGETPRQSQAKPVKQQHTGISPNHVPEAVRHWVTQNCTQGFVGTCIANTIY